MNRVDQIWENLRERRLFVTEEQRPYRTVVATERKPRYRNAVLSDSLAFGVFLADTLVVSCPGATLDRLGSEVILRDLERSGVENVAVLGGTNNLVNRDQTVNDLQDVTDELEDLITRLKAAGFNVVIMKIPGRRGFKEEIKNLKKKYKETAAKYNVGFHDGQKFTVGGLSRDGLHPAPDKIQKLSKDCFDALRGLH